MAKKKQHQQPPAGIAKTTQTAKQTPLSEVNVAAKSPFSLYTDFKLHAFIIAIVAFIFYYNTFPNEFALDDVMVIQQNDYVHQGVSGIPDILSKDTYDGYYKQMNSANLFSGGRYRPLSVVTFAIEEQMLGIDKDENPTLGQAVSENAQRYMTTRHVVNVLLYIAAVIALLCFLRCVVFKEQPFTAFIAALLFTIHPLHTEVVANIKSRDEILSLLFICLTFIYAYKYKETNKIAQLCTALTCYFLALLSKEYAITLIVLIPMMFYIFKNCSIKDSLKTVLPYTGVLVIYFIIRLSVVSHKLGTADTNLQNNPYLFATGIQSICSRVATLLDYIKLLLVPYPLSSDYSYSQIPFSNLGDLKFLASLLLHFGIFVMAVRLFLKRNILGFAFSFYLFNLLLVSNLLFNIGATMGERLIFHSSVGFAILAAYLLVFAADKIKLASISKPVLAVVMLLLTLICGYMTIARNTDWKNTNTLFIKDVKTVPNSFLANGIAGVGYCALSELPENKANATELQQKGIACLTKSVTIYNKYVQGYYNRALAYDQVGEWEKAISDLDTVKKYYVTFPSLYEQYQLIYHDMGMAYWKAKNYNRAITAFKEGCRVVPKDPEMWYMLGITYYTIKDYKQAIDVFDTTLKIDPKHTAAINARSFAEKFFEKK